MVLLELGREFDALFEHRVKKVLLVPVVGVHKWKCPFQYVFKASICQSCITVSCETRTNMARNFPHLGSDGVVDPEPTVTDGGVLPQRLLVGEEAVDGIGSDGIWGDTDGHVGGFGADGKDDVLYGR